MTDITYGGSAQAPSAPARKNVWARMLDALYEARMRQVEREIARVAHLIPRDALEQAGLKVTQTSDAKLPFVR